MAKRDKSDKPIAQSLIQYGYVDDDGKRVVVEFNAGDEVTGVDDKTMEQLIAGKSVKVGE